MLKRLLYGLPVLGIDLGSFMIRTVGPWGKMQMPSICSPSLGLVGKEAEEIEGRTPAEADCVWPFSDGAIQDEVAGEVLLRHVLHETVQVSPWLRELLLHGQPGSLGAICAVPGWTTSSHRSSLKKMMQMVGLGKIWLVPSSFVIAQGISPNWTGLLILAGSSSWEIVRVVHGQPDKSRTLTISGREMDRMLQQYVRETHGCELGLRSLREMKHALTTSRSVIVRGKAIDTGLPVTKRLVSAEVLPVLRQSFSVLADTIEDLMIQASASVVPLLQESGVVICGGASSLIQEEELARSLQNMHLLVRTIEKSDQAVMRGLDHMLKHVRRAELGQATQTWSLMGEE